MKQLTIPEPTVDSNTRTYNIDLSQYKEIMIDVGIMNYGNADSRSICIRPIKISYSIDYIDHNKYKWHGIVRVNKESIEIKTLDDSSNQETFYLYLRFLSAR